MSLELVSAVQRMKRGVSSHLNIGYIANIHYGLLPATLGAFRKLCPRVALNLFDMTSAEQFTALENHKIDLGFIGLRPARSHRDLLAEAVNKSPGCRTKAWSSARSLPRSAANRPSPGARTIPPSC